MQRCRKRTVRYGNWRQIYYDHDGICRRCGVPFFLEFHEEFGNGSAMNCELFTVLCCNICHGREHPEWIGRIVVRQYQRSVLSEDIEREIEECGGLREWMSRYGITDRGDRGGSGGGGVDGSARVCDILK